MIGRLRAWWRGRQASTARHRASTPAPPPAQPAWNDPTPVQPNPALLEFGDPTHGNSGPGGPLHFTPAQAYRGRGGRVVDTPSDGLPSVWLM